MDQNGPFWAEEVYFGPFRSANRTLVIPEYRAMLPEAPAILFLRSDIFS